MNENPMAERSTRNWHDLWSLAFEKARELLKAQEPETWEEKDAREHYWAALPMIASQMYGDLGRESCALHNEGPSTLDEHHRCLEVLMSEIRRRKFAGSAAP